MPSVWTIGALAGLAGALLYFPVLTQSPLSGIATFVAPLPLYLAGLSAGAMAAAIGTGVVCLVSAALTGLPGVVSYVALIGLPAMAMSSLLLLNRDTALPAGSTQVEWYPAGRTLCWLACGASVLFLIAAFAAMGQEGGLRAQTEELFLPAMGGREQFVAMLAELQPSADPEVLIEIMTATLPTALVIYLAAMVAANAGIAQRILVRTGRALRPSPPIKSMDLPVELDIALALSVALSLAPGEAGFIGGSLAVILMTPYFLLGLIVIHAISLRWPGRAAILTLLYCAMLFVQPLSFLIAALGLMEQWYSLRRQYGGLGPRQPGSDGE